MTEFKYGDIVKCVYDDNTQVGPLKEGGLYVIEAVASHGKSVRVAGDWHKVARFEKVGESDLVPNEDEQLKVRMGAIPARIDECHRALMSAFVWSKTEEGESYWRDVATRLDDYYRRFR